MSEKEFNTLKNFVNSNNSFYNAIKNEEIITSDIYISFELLLLYFKINYEFLPKLNQAYYNMLSDIIKNNNFIIEHNNIFYNDQYYPISYFIKLLNTIEVFKSKPQENKIIKLSFNSKEIKKRKTKTPKIIDLSVHHRNIYFTMKEREYMFEENMEVNDITLPFIENSNIYFKELLNYLIILIFKEPEHIVNYQYLELLYSYISLYPFVCYSKDKEEIPFFKLNIPQNEIGLKKTTYKPDEYLKCLEEEMQELANKRERLQNQKETMKSCLSNCESKLSRVDQHIYAIEAKQMDNHFAQYTYKHTNEVYNANLLEFIIKSFEQGNVYINESFEDPVIKLFYTEHNEVLFYCAMHLKTLTKLCDSNILLPESQKDKKLKLGK